MKNITEAIGNKMNPFALPMLKWRQTIGGIPPYGKEVLLFIPSRRMFIFKGFFVKPEDGEIEDWNREASEDKKNGRTGDDAISHLSKWQIADFYGNFEGELLNLGHSYVEAIDYEPSYWIYQEELRKMLKVIGKKKRPKKPKDS